MNYKEYQVTEETKSYLIFFITKSVLKEIGFLNKIDPPIVSFEVKPFGQEDSDLVVANAKRVLNLAWAKL